jgi:hypothetical protein
VPSIRRRLDGAVHVADASVMVISTRRVGARSKTMSSAVPRTPRPCPERLDVGLVSAEQVGRTEFGMARSRPVRTCWQGGGHFVARI